MTRSALLGVLLVAGLLAGPAHAADARSMLEQFLARAKTLSAMFEQRLLDETGRLKERSTGSLLMQRPGMFRWTYDDPYGQDLISDGTRVWIHDRGLEQVTVRRLDAALSETPAALLTSTRPIEESFSVGDSVERDGVDWIELEPRGEEAVFQRIRIGFVQGSFRFMEIEDSFSNLTELRFDELVVNAPIPEGVFDFTPPVGADVIDATN